uniref:MARVEL domain-containing protein n=2 Tax=Caenorhabditis tropicalis TaxID=1561998 RepID=A0A1I7TNP5_9PELO
MPAEPEGKFRMIQGYVSKKISPFIERAQRFVPGIMLQLFAFCKFAIVLYCVFQIPMNKDDPATVPFTIPVTVTILCINAVLLLAAASQDFCSLIISLIMTFFLSAIYIFLLVIGPVFVTSFFASDVAKHSTIPREFRIFSDYINYNSNQEKLFKNGIKTGFSVETVLLFLVAVTLLQFSLIKSTLYAKLDQLKREKQEKEKRNSVYLI